MIDASLVFDGTTATDPPVPAAITTSRVSTNVIDLLVARDVGTADVLGLHVDVMTAFTGGTSLQIDFEVCATAGGSYLPLVFSPVIPAAQLIVGAPIFRYGVPLNQVLNATAGVLAAPGRFIRLNYTVVGTFSTGAVFSYLNAAKDRTAFYTYPSNYTVNVATGEI